MPNSLNFATYTIGISGSSTACFISAQHHLVEVTDLSSFLELAALSFVKKAVKGGDRQDVPHELVSEEFLSFAWAAIIIFFVSCVASVFGVAKARLHGRCEDAQY